MKTHSTLTLAVLLCLGLGSVEGSSRRCCLDNLSFTLRLSHLPSQNEDSALRRTTALKVAAAGGEIKNVHINKQSAEVKYRVGKSTENLFNHSWQEKRLHIVFVSEI